MRYLLTSFLLLVAICSFSQQAKSIRAASSSPSDNKRIYLEVLGSGGLGSINYEWIFKEKGITRWALRPSISYAPVDVNNGSVFIFPLMVHAIIGKNGHYGDVGFGQSPSITTRGSFFLRTPLSFGYRLEPEGKRLFYRVSYTPIVSNIFEFQWQHWGGASIGYRFNTAKN